MNKNTVKKYRNSGNVPESEIYDIVYSNSSVLRALSLTAFTNSSLAIDLHYNNKNYFNSKMISISYNVGRVSDFGYFYLTGVSFVRPTYVNRIKKDIEGIFYE